MSKIKVSIEDTSAHPAPANGNDTFKSIGVLVGVIIKRLSEGRRAS